MPEHHPPSVGRIVHYVSHGTPIHDDGSQAHPPACRVAIITEVPEYLTAEPLDGCPNGTQGQWLASLAVLNPTGVLFSQNVAQDENTHTGGTWHWPERV
ncbi:hypothetical protein KQY30_24995 [Streptomyces sp. GMY02]|uniref:hypothetical protein n=1 Tax=Streptomyces sp. GMY02 TaxID=1333528 RepID=UPI001C2C7750|nr:hypothetical protein [Streptomyces sp. GMY02]QXE36983.1 hypothetical protein KQY30_24995 [Streptomyces sp. GMY02]